MRHRLLLTLGGAALFVMGGVVGPSVADRMMHPRDEDGFQDYVVIHMLHPGTQQDEDWAADHPDEILAEGNRACVWLSLRERAPDVDPSGAASVHNLVDAYLRDTRDDSTEPLTRLGHATVVHGAWEYLCRADRDDNSAPESEDED
jgi:hypothetical protein